MGFFKKLFKGGKEAGHAEAEAGTTTATNPAPSSNTHTPHPDTSGALDNEVKQVLSASTNAAASPPHPTVGETPSRRSMAEGAGHRRTGSDSSNSIPSSSRRGSTTSLSKAAQAALSARAQAAAAGLSLSVVSVKADDNSFFRALAHQLYGSETLHLSLRHKVADYLHKNTATYRPLFPATVAYSNYVDQLRFGANVKSAGDAAQSVVLRATANLYGMELVLLVVADSGDEVPVHRYQPQPGLPPPRPTTPPGDSYRPANPRSVTPTALQLNSGLSMDRQASAPPPAEHTATGDEAASEASSISGAATPLVPSPGPGDAPSGPVGRSQHELNKARQVGHRRTASVPSTFTATALHLLVEDTTGLFFSLVPRQQTMRLQQRSTSSLAAGRDQRGSVANMHHAPQGLIVGPSTHLQPPGPTQFDYGVTFHN